MEYVFSWSWFFIGILVLLAGAALTVWYRQISDILGGGVSTYERYRAAGIIGCALGLLVMLNLHTLILGWFFGLLFGGLR